MTDDRFHARDDEEDLSHDRLVERSQNYDDYDQQLAVVPSLEHFMGSLLNRLLDARDRPDDLMPWEGEEEEEEEEEDVVEVVDGPVVVEPDDFAPYSDDLYTDGEYSPDSSLDDWSVHDPWRLFRIPPPDSEAEEVDVEVVDDEDDTDKPTSL